MNGIDISLTLMYKVVSHWNIFDVEIGLTPLFHMFIFLFVVGEFCDMEQRDGVQLLQCSWERKTKFPPDLMGKWASDTEKSSDTNVELENVMSPPVLPVAGIQEYNKPIYDALFTHKHNKDSATVSSSIQYDNYPVKRVTLFSFYKQILTELLLFHQINILKEFSICIVAVLH